MSFSSRALTVEDAGAVAELINELDRAYLEDPDTVSAADLTGWWIRLDLPADSLGFFADDGTLVAVATVTERKSGILDLDPYVRPSYQGRGLGSALLDWHEAEAHRRGRAVLQTAALTADLAAHALVTARGFRPARHFSRMLIDLVAPPPEPVWPAGFELTPFRPGDEAILHAVTEEAFADHWGHEDRDLDDWRRTVFGQEWWDPSLVYLVRHEGEVVAAEINAVRFGVGWIGTIGTRKPWRGNGLGRALVLEAFGEFYRRGEHRIGLAVDAGNETGATHLYESVGMRVAWQADVYEKRL